MLDKDPWVKDLCHLVILACLENVGQGDGRERCAPPTTVQVAWTRTCTGRDTMGGDRSDQILESR